MIIFGIEAAKAESIEDGYDGATHENEKNIAFFGIGDDIGRNAHQLLQERDAGGTAQSFRTGD